MVAELFGSDPTTGVQYVRPDEVGRLLEMDLAVTVTDSEIKELLIDLHRDLAASIREVEEILLAASGPEYDYQLEAAGLTALGRATKVGGFRRAIDEPCNSSARSDQSKWVYASLRWGGIALASMARIARVGTLTEPIREFAECTATPLAEDRPNWPGGTPSARSGA